MTYSGWRKPTPDPVTAQARGRAGEGTSVAKGRALSAAKRVGARLGLKAADLLLLDMLGAFSQEGDWEEGARPIVWPSNATLMARTGFSLSALKRHVRRLAEAGMIAFEDSPNGKRWGRRDRDGRIVEAYGFDLAPLRARAQEFERLEQVFEAERRTHARLRRQVTIARRGIQASLDLAATRQPAGPWQRLRALLTRLLARLPRPEATRGHFDAILVDAILTRLAKLQRLLDRALFRGGPGASEADPLGAISEPPIPTTNQPEFVEENRDEPNQRPSLVSNHPPKSRADQIPLALDLAEIHHACPEFVSWGQHFQDPAESWPALARLADALHPMIGISRPTWTTARALLGERAASAALALVFDRACRGIIAAPDAYLRGLLRRARAGELRLERSFRPRSNLMPCRAARHA